MTQAVVVLIFQRDQVLLAMKKRGFGAGRWNGTGGKCSPGELPRDAAVRETVEEIGVRPTLREPLGIIEFFNSSKGDWTVSVFRADEFEGAPKESEEMKPQWFPLDRVPFENMWPDDRYWLPFVVEGKAFRAKFWFGPDDNSIEKYEIDPPKP